MPPLTFHHQIFYGHSLLPYERKKSKLSHLSRINSLQNCRQTLHSTNVHLQVFSFSFFLRSILINILFPYTKIRVSWNMTPCLLVICNQYLENFVTFDLPEDLDSRFLRNIRNKLPVTRPYFQNTKLHQQLFQNLRSHIQYMFFA